MASLWADTGDNPSFVGMSQQGPTITTQRYELLACLPPGHLVRTYSKFGRLQADATSILETLRANDNDGNQWLVILSLTTPAIERLDNDKSCLGGIDYRFQWDGSIGLIKILPSPSHEYATNNLALVVNDSLAAMGIPLNDRAWGLATTYKPTISNKGKQGDQIFTPASRKPVAGNVVAWPTVVVETGVSESHSKLQEDAKWWFENSNGAVRIVLVIVVKSTYVRFEKWQLVPPNAPAPITRAYLDQLRQQQPHIPPLVTQPPSTQHAYSAQEVMVTPTTVTGAPMILPFQALYDRPHGPNDTDVVITAQHFREIVDEVF